MMPVFRKKKKHERTVGELLELTSKLDEKLTEMGLCSHELAIVGMLMMMANNSPEPPLAIGGLMKGSDLKEVLEKIKDKIADIDEE